MKKILFSIAACAAVLAGCTASEPEMKVKADAVPFSAKIDEDLTKVNIDGLAVSWEAGEKAFIGAMDAEYAGGDVKVTKNGIYQTGSAGTLTDLEYESGDVLSLADITAAGAKFFAFSPASMVSAEGGAVSLALPATQTYITDGVKEFPMIGFSEANPTSTELSFRYVCGALKFNLKGVNSNQTVKSIVITADQELSGKVGIEKVFDVCYVNVIEGTKKVTLNCGDGVKLSDTEATPFYVSLPKGAYTGMKITFNFADGGQQTFSAGANSVTIAPNGLYTITKTIRSSADKAILPTGTDFNLTIKKLVAVNPVQEIVTSTTDYKIKKIVFDINSKNTNGQKIQAEGSASPIYLSVDAGNGLVTVSTPAAALFANADASFMFNDFGGLEKIENLDVLNTENVTTMQSMFNMADCLTEDADFISPLKSLDVSKFNTAKVTSFRSMFNSLNSLESVDVSKFNTGSATTLRMMFRNCKALASVDVSKFNTENVTDMSYMFYQCWSLTSLKMANFDTRKVTDMSYMFFYCRNIETIDVTGWNTDKVTTMVNMFGSMYKLRKLDIRSFSCKSIPVSSNVLSNLAYFIQQDGALEEIWFGPDFGNKSDQILPPATFVISAATQKISSHRTCTENLTGKLIVHCTQTVANWCARTALRWVNTGYSTYERAIPVTFVDLETGKTLKVTWRAN